MASVRVVALHVGDAYPDSYLERLHSMVCRHLSGPKRFTVFTDRMRALPSSAEQIDCSGWGLEGYFNKLRLFDRRVTGREPFLYLDLTLVIRAPLDRLVGIAEGSSASLIAVDDWNYPGLNSSVMWVRPDDRTQRVWDDFRGGTRYHARLPGDQNFIDAAFRARFPDAVEFWPRELVMSYKKLRKLAAGEPDLARQAYASCTILKFHGRPKPHEVLRPWLRPGATLLRHPFRPRLWRYLADELRLHWG